MPPAKMLSITVDLLERIARGAADTETNALLSALRAEGEGSEDPLAAERLLGQLASQVRYARESALADRGLNLLIETAHDLSSTLSLQDLLRKIVSRARSLVSADIAWLTIRDEKEGLFRNIAAEGHLAPGTAMMTSQFDRGAVSVIMNTKTFFTTSNYLADDRFTHSAALDRQFGIENIESLAGLPAFSGDTVQGLLFVADRYARQYSGREISVLGSFAQHAGMAMRNARTFERLSEALDETERNRSALERHVKRVEASAQTHDEMMSLLAQGADLATFMRRMAGHIGGSIQYLDSALTVRHEVTADEYDGLLSEEMRQGRLDQTQLLSALVRSRENGRSVLLCETGNERCLVLALHGGSVRGDSLIVCHTGRIDEIHLRNLERSAVALSIAKLWTEKRETDRLIASSTLLRHLVLVSPTDASTVASVRDRLGLGMQQPVRLALIVLSGMKREEQTAQIRQAGGRLNILLDLIDGAYLAVGPLKEVDKLIETLSQRGESVQIGGLISKPYCDLAASPTHYARLGNALRTMERIAPLHRFIGEGDVNLFARLFEGGDPRRIQEFVKNTLDPITARDPRGRAQLKATLLCFFDCQFNIARAAEELDIHVNTVRRRLETLREVTGGWNDPIAALELHVALKLDKIISTA
ncbi:helix-turn-helix domain-containing protein [Jiella pacifica]|uniref:GAF domain-containing protein n=1 Tax=Jiella pacifica TaxID=2696469 RepID=A0A6N9T7T2_9HYPH|nr:helix-turn-helix domain-containing protein [Jiella pacifica]NDW07330.1 GAF domain-containing protein [Jiella pacifica]